MEQKILQGINNIGYTGSFKEQSVFSQGIDEGPKNVEYTKFVSYLTNELRSLCNVDEEVNPITAPEDSVSFMMELSSFLKELGCPHDCLTQGHISDRLESKEDKLLVLDYLLTEMMAARMLQDKKPDKKIELKLKESPQAASLKKMLIVLRFPKPPANITVQGLFQKLNPTVLNLVQRAGEGLLGRPICNFMINEKQWKTLQTVQEDLHSEYKIRREMLLKRLDCTIQSFQWSDRMRGKDELIDRTYSEKRKQLKVEPEVDMSDFLCARQDLAIIEKTSNASVRKNTQTAINKVMIGKVPDRGGRTSEQAPPPPEMPSWQQRSGPSGGGGGRGGGRGRGRGDFNNRDGFSARGGYDNSGGYGNNSNRGNDYNSARGGQSNASFGSGGNNYSGGGNNYSGGGNNYSGGGNHYNKGGDYNRNQGNYGSSSNLGGFVSSYKKTAPVTYGGTVGNYLQSTYGGSDSRGGGNRSSGEGRNQSFDSAGSYSTNYGRSGGGSDKRGGGSDNRGGGSDNRGGGSDNRGRGRDSTGSTDYQNEPKRPKTYDSFQNNKTTYADQYVQESQNNQQYQPRGGGNRRGGGGRGRSNYNRGGY